MASHRSPRPDALATSVQRIRVPSRQDFHATIVEAGRPVILEGAIDDWELRSMSADAMLDRFAALAGKHKVYTATARSGGSLFWKAENHERVQDYTEAAKRFSSFVAEVRRSGPSMYMAAEAVRESLPELLPLFELDLLADQQVETPRLWIGNGGHRVAMHYDRDDNLMCMLSGRKRFMFYPPSATPGLYVGGFGTEPGRVATAMVDPLHPDPDRFPKFREVEHELVVADLAPGDVLYAPAHWWHHVESFDLNIAVAFFWPRTTPQERLGAEAAFVHGLLSLRPLPAHLRRVYREMFDNYVFHEHGEPYAHLDEPRQGWAGRPTPARVDELRDRLRQLIEGSGVLGTISNVDLRHEHVLATGLSFHVSDDNIEIRGAGELLVVPFAVFEILREFRSPTVPRKLAAKRFPRSKPARSDFERMCHALVVRRLLVDCELG